MITNRPPKNKVMKKQSSLPSEFYLMFPWMCVASVTLIGLHVTYLLSLLTIIIV